MMKKETKISSINYRSHGEDVDVYYSQLVGVNSRANFCATIDRMLLHRLNKEAGLVEYLETYVKKEEV